MEKFNKEFNKNYEFLYNSNDYVAGSREALEYFDNSMTSEEKEILKQFVLYRGDFISSDREAIAFMFTLDSIN